MPHPFKTPVNVPSPSMSSCNKVRSRGTKHRGSAVTETPAATRDEAVEHFSSEFRFETDCWDVHEAIGSDDPCFVLIDVRSPELYARGHVSGAINLPHRKIIESKILEWDPSTLFVTYCAGPHRNGAVRGALRLAKLGRPVKIMAGGITG